MNYHKGLPPPRLVRFMVCIRPAFPAGRPFLFRPLACLRTMCLHSRLPARPDQPGKKQGPGASDRRFPTEPKGTRAVQESCRAGGPDCQTGKGRLGRGNPSFGNRTDTGRPGGGARQADPETTRPVRRTGRHPGPALAPASATQHGQAFASLLLEKCGQALHLDAPALRPGGQRSGRASAAIGQTCRQPGGAGQVASGGGQTAGKHQRQKRRPARGQTGPCQKHPHHPGTARERGRGALGNSVPPWIHSNTNSRP